MMRLAVSAIAAAAPLAAASAGGSDSLWKQWLRGPPSTDIPLSDPRLRSAGGVEQVHITGGSPDSVIVTYVTNSSEPTAVKYAKAAEAEDSTAWVSVEGPVGKVYSTLMDPRFPETEGGCQGSVNYTNPGCFYTSGEIHSVELPGLTPNTKYTYSCGSDTAQTFSFKTPPAVGATASLKIAVVGDLGQTENSSATVDMMEAELSAGNVDLILHAGDLSYADGNGYRCASSPAARPTTWQSLIIRPFSSLTALLYARRGCIRAAGPEALGERAHRARGWQPRDLKRR